LGETAAEKQGHVEKDYSCLESEAYRKAFRLALCTHGVTRGFPDEERRAMVPDILESAIAIPVSIANGYRFRSRKELLDHLYVAVGKCARLESQLSLSYDLKYIPQKDYETVMALEEEVSRTLQQLISELEA
jgi:four helix bundle protein